MWHTHSSHPWGCASKGLPGTQYYLTSCHGNHSASGHCGVPWCVPLPEKQDMEVSHVTSLWRVWAMKSCLLSTKCKPQLASESLLKYYGLCFRQIRAINEACYDCSCRTTVGLPKRIVPLSGSDTVKVLDNRTLYKPRWACYSHCWDHSLYNTLHVMLLFGCPIPTVMGIGNSLYSNHSNQSR